MDSHIIIWMLNISHSSYEKLLHATYCFYVVCLFVCFLTIKILLAEPGLNVKSTEQTPWTEI